MDAFKWLWLKSCFGASSKRLWEVVSAFPSPDEAFNFLSGSLNVSAPKILTEAEISGIKHIHDNQIAGIISYCENHNINILCYNDKNYPAALYNLYCPPPVLFCKGDISVLNSEYTAAVVGARQLSDYGKIAAEKISAELAEFGFVIVSGFAEGTDIAAQLAAVRNNGKTIAVLGCGVDYDYPAPNKIYRSKIEKNGVFISEYPPLSAPAPSQFLARNRILSGLALCVAVIEAAEKSGTFNTVTHANAQGKGVFVLPPHDIFDRRYFGNVSLLRDGAVPLLGAADIACEYITNKRHNSVKNNSLDNVNFNKIDDYEKIIDGKSSENEASRDEADIYTLDERCQIIYNILKTHNSAVEINDAAGEANMDVSEILEIFTELEMNGLAASDDGQSYKIV